jgi:hypothetical protein
MDDSRRSEYDAEAELRVCTHLEEVDNVERKQSIICLETVHLPAECISASSNNVFSDDIRSCRMRDYGFFDSLYIDEGWWKKNVLENRDQSPSLPRPSAQSKKMIIYSNDDQMMER